MKKLIIITVATLTILVGGFFIWWNLPLTINRSTEIKLGEEIIIKIEDYQKTYGLPGEDDWEALRKFGFQDKIDFLQPEYRQLDNHTFELINDYP